MRSLQIGESATPDEEEAIERVLGGDPRVREVVSLRTVYLGPEDLLPEDMNERPADSSPVSWCWGFSAPSSHSP